MDKNKTVTINAGLPGPGTSELRPLISFCVFVYNQEAFIREAVCGAFSQTYSPLEIVLSDDCSSDNSFTIMEEMVAGYRGPHRIVLNRNEINLGVGEHVNRVMALSHGELVVAAGGDDVSFPQRTQVLYEAWRNREPRPTSIHSDWETIDETGTPLVGYDRKDNLFKPWVSGLDEILDYVRGKRPHPALIHGATHAMSRRLFQLFGPLGKDVTFEDKVLSLRSLICGSITYVPQKLIRYRMHSGNVWAQRSRQGTRYSRVRKGLQQAAIQAVRWEAVLRNYRADVMAAVGLGLLSDDDGAKILEAVALRQEVKHCEKGVLSAPPGRSLMCLIRRVRLLPEYRYAWFATKHWLFRSADYYGLLPRR